MIKDLDEAIQHCLEVANEKERQSGFETDYEMYRMSDAEREECKKCAEEHRQLAEWLKELKNIYGFIEKYPSTDAIYIGDIKDILKGEI